MTPKMQAQIDYKGGGGQTDNPYPQNTKEHEEYAFEMSRLWGLELKAINAELRAGV